MTPKEFLRSKNIELYSVLEFERAIVTDAHKLQKYEGFTPRSILIFAIPYFIGSDDEHNLSLYAIAKDYHLFFKEISGEIIDFLKKLHPAGNFLSFADSSPIDERHAAAISGIGILGESGLIITKKYGSYVFLGEIISDIDAEAFGIPKSYTTIKNCIGCGKCKDACPKKETPTGECLSAITQKKGELSDDEKNLITKYGLIWGCDICQRVCPYNKDLEITPIDFFKKDLIKIIDRETVDKMPKDEFRSRAWSWRGKSTVMRNIALFEKDEENDR